MSIILCLKCIPTSLDDLKVQSESSLSSLEEEKVADKTDPPKDTAKVFSKILIIIVVLIL